MKLSYKTSDIIEIGVDEAGRGPLFGRVYTAAVNWDNSVVIPNDIKICDSKKLKKKDIDKSYDFIIKNAKNYSITYSTEQEIDELNILQATMKSMHKSITNVINNIKGDNILKDKELLLLIDGTYFNKYKLNDKIINNLCIKGGDNKYISIACASILAKYTRDKYIEDLCTIHPELEVKYKILSNKGYGTAYHMNGIKTHGITEFHRKSYKPCQ
jgi:ribonuclease HII